MKTESKVGALVITAALGLGWLSTQSNVGGNGLEGDVRALTSTFSDVEGVMTGSKVKVAGLEVGEISAIRLNSDGSATIEMIVKEDTPLPSNVKAKITTSGLIGEKYVALTTDFTAEGELAEDISHIPSMGTVDAANMAQDFSKVADDLQQITASLRSALGGPENAEKLSRIVDSIDGLTAKLNNEIEDDKVKTIVDNLEQFSVKLNEQSGDMVADLRDSSAALRKILADNEQNAGDLIKNLGVASKNLAVITDQMASGEGMLGKLIMEDSTAIDDFQVAMADLKEITGKINKGEGTIGRLINDPSTAEKIDGALDSFSNIAGRLETFRTEVDFHGYQLASEDVGKGRMNITFRPRPSRYYVVGVTADGFATEAEDGRSTASFRGEDFGEDIKFTAQFGHVFEGAAFGEDIGIRVGLKDSSFGFGADMAFLDDNLEFNADVYDLTGENSGTSGDNAHVDLTARYMLWNKSLYAIGGYDNLLNEKYGSPFLGLGWKFQDDDLKYLVGSAL